MRIDDREQRRAARHEHDKAAGLPIWGVLLIIVGAVALLDNVGIGVGWIFGLAIGAWFVYLGVRHYNQSGDINWWLVGLGLLIGLGSVSTGFADQFIFPVVLIIVGLGILGQQYMSRQRQ